MRLELLFRDQKVELTLKYKSNKNIQVASLHKLQIQGEKLINSNSLKCMENDYISEE